MQRLVHAILVTGGFCAVVIVGSVWWGSQQQSGLTKHSDAKLHVVTSFYPYYYLTQEIGKDLIEVTDLTPAGVEPHDYEPNTQAVVAMEQSQMVVVNGMGLEPWFGQVQKQLQRNGVRVVVAADSIAAQERQIAGEKQIDPHIWLDPVNAQAVSASIAETLIELDPEHQAQYKANESHLQAALAQLDADFRGGLTGCRIQTFITAHEAFGYLAERYGLTQVGITGLSPEAEPAAQTLAMISNLVKQDGIKYIFYETLVSPRIAQTVAAETGAQTAVLDPIEGLTPAEERAGDNYLTIQESNLQQLVNALECSHGN